MAANPLPPAPMTHTFSPRSYTGVPSRQMVAVLSRLTPVLPAPYGPRERILSGPGAVVHPSRAYGVPMDLLDCHRRALARTEELVNHVAPDRLGAPTPCRAWDVLALMNHLVLGNRLYAWCARGRSADDFDVHRDFVGDDPVEAYLASVRDIDGALADPSVLERTFALRGGPVPGTEAVATHLTELVAHGWDLARATGQPLGMPDDV